MTPQEFITKWGPGGPAFDLNERQGAQPHFIDLCQLLGVPLPLASTPSSTATPARCTPFCWPSWTSPKSKSCCAACGWTPRASARKKPAATSLKPPPRALPPWPRGCASAPQAVRLGQMWGGSRGLMNLRFQNRPRRRHHLWHPAQPLPRTLVAAHGHVAGRPSALHPHHLL